MSKKRLEHKEDFDLLVNTFYAKVQKDPLIGPFFTEIVKVHWDSHIPKISNFWEDLINGTNNYKGRPFPPHIKLDLKFEHFERWIFLFVETVDENFEGLKAEEIKNRAIRIAKNFMVNLGIIQIPQE